MALGFQVKVLCECECECERACECECECECERECECECECECKRERMCVQQRERVRVRRRAREKNVVPHSLGSRGPVSALKWPEFKPRPEGSRAPRKALRGGIQRSILTIFSGNVGDSRQMLTKTSTNVHRIPPRRAFCGFCGSFPRKGEGYLHVRFREKRKQPETF